MKTDVFARSCLLLAGLILCLHTVVPHVHGEQAGVTGQPYGLVDILKDLLGSDLGEDHLEHFSSGQDLDLSVDVVAALPPFAQPVLVLLSPRLASLVRRRRVFRHRHFPPSAVYPDADAPRGPPRLA